jgi:hypothetical protein
MKEDINLYFEILVVKVRKDKMQEHPTKNKNTK